MLRIEPEKKRKEQVPLGKHDAMIMEKRDGGAARRAQPHHLHLYISSGTI